MRSSLARTPSFVALPSLQHALAMLCSYDDLSQLRRIKTRVTQKFLQPFSKFELVMMTKSGASNCLKLKMRNTKVESSTTWVMIFLDNDEGDDEEEDDVQMQPFSIQAKPLTTQ